MSSHDFIREIGRLSAESARLRAALTDLEQHGTRHDLIPTHVPGDEEFWHRYIASMDANVRNRARVALEDGAA